MIQIQIIGNLGADPEMQYTPQGDAVTSFSVACHRPKNSEGQDQSPTWVKVSAWGKRAEFSNSYLNKGNKVFVQGGCRIDEYLDRNGDKKYSLSIPSADSIQFMSNKPEPEVAFARDIVKPSPESPESPELN